MKTPILPVEPAKTLCAELIAQLNSSPLGDALKKPGHGRMFGILACTDGSVFKAFSGLLEGNYGVESNHRIESNHGVESNHGFKVNYGLEGFVPPVFETAKMYELLKRQDETIKSSKNPREASRQCWKEIQSLYAFHCFDGSIQHLSDIFPDSPSGTGDCCAPKLLSYAYSLGKKPLSLAEFFYGSSTYSNNNAYNKNEHLKFYNPCNFRCKPILKYILGLDIEYYDGDIVVVNKPSGMLSIEGKGEDKKDCIASRVRTLYEGCIAQPCVHRLDMATSGLLVLGLTKIAHDALSLSFEKREVYKEYEALVHGIVHDNEGIINLPIRLDVQNRPHQIVDFDNGKTAITKWKKLSIENHNKMKFTRLQLIPLTGRTHQLRVHCAYGLNPIVGDTLYGDTQKDKEANTERMMLQARKLSFKHPISKEDMEFELQANF